MAALGADYSWARPGGAALHAAGVSGVGRYLATDGRGITAAEYQDLRMHGLDVWVCREGAAAGMLSGRAQGVADAQLAEQQIGVVGLPANIPVFATADFDVQSSQFAACDDYLRGFASVLGVGRVGIYGGLHYMNHAYAAGLATHFWQAGATSWDHGESPQMPINFQQTTNTPPLPGTDHNFIYAMPAGGGATPIVDKPKASIDMPQIRHRIDNSLTTWALYDATHWEEVNSNFKSPDGKTTGQDVANGWASFYGASALVNSAAGLAYWVQRSNDPNRHSFSQTGVTVDPAPVVAAVKAALSGLSVPPATVDDAAIAAAVDQVLADNFAAIPGAVNDDAAKRLAS
jgi:hypothetical protein